MSARVIEALLAARGKRTAAAELLGISAERMRQLIERDSLRSFEALLRSIYAPLPFERVQRVRTRASASTIKRVRERRARGLCRCQRRYRCARVARGQCARCPSPRVRGRHHCQGCLDAQAAAHAARKGRSWPPPPRASWREAVCAALPRTSGRAR